MRRRIPFSLGASGRCGGGNVRALPADLGIGVGEEVGWRGAGQAEVRCGGVRLWTDGRGAICTVVATAANLA